jgi:hypothetical protein
LVTKQGQSLFGTLDRNNHKSYTSVSKKKHTVKYNSIGNVWFEIIENATRFFTTKELVGRDSHRF